MRSLYRSAAGRGHRPHITSAVAFGPDQWGATRVGVGASDADLCQPGVSLAELATENLQEL